MAENSKIEWCDHTFNPWMGCTKVSEGCKHCYAETLMDKRYGKVKWGPQGQRVRTSAANWRKPLAWNRQAEQEGRRFRVFCASLADVFEDRSDQPEMDIWRSDLFDLIDATPNLDWLLLTKRPENVMRLWPSEWYDCFGAWHNLWIGTSVENQEQANKRIPELLKVPAAVRFLSCEPLLGPIDFHTGGWGSIGGQFCHKCGGFGWYEEDGMVCPRCHQSGFTTHAKIHWVIVGGESGTSKRPFDPNWARSIRDQCQAAGVPFFMKQMDKVQQIPDDLMIRQFPQPREVC